MKYFWLGLLLALVGAAYAFDRALGAALTLWSLGTLLGDDVQDTIAFRYDRSVLKPLFERLDLPPTSTAHAGWGPEPLWSIVNAVRFTFADAWHLAKFVKHTCWAAAVVFVPFFAEPTLLHVAAYVALFHAVYGATHEAFFGGFYVRRGAGEEVGTP